MKIEDFLNKTKRSENGKPADIDMYAVKHDLKKAKLKSIKATRTLIFAALSVLFAAAAVVILYFIMCRLNFIETDEHVSQPGPEVTTVEIMTLPPEQQFQKD